MNKKLQIAIDGPAGSGKGTVALELSKRLGISYIDTGAMYRMVALYCINNNIDMKNSIDVVNVLDDVEIDIDEGRFFLNGDDVTNFIRTSEVSVGSSLVAVIPEVRKKMRELQQKIAESKSVVMEGRDICNSVLPNADVKIFLTATVDERAKRRYNQLLEKGNCNLSFEEVKKDLEWRDYNDSNREEDPLELKNGTFLLDSTSLTIDDIVNKIINMCK